MPKSNFADPASMPHRYLITYTLTGPAGSGRGICDVGLSHPIGRFVDVLRLEADLAARHRASRLFIDRIVPLRIREVSR